MILYKGLFIFRSLYQGYQLFVIHALITAKLICFRLAGVATNTYCLKGIRCNQTDGNDPDKIRQGKTSFLVSQIFTQLMF